MNNKDASLAGIIMILVGIFLAFINPGVISINVILAGWIVFVLSNSRSN